MGIPLGVIPAGTINHFAREVGVGRDVAQALRVLAGGYTLPVDAARVNERIFLNNSSIGLYARVVEIRVTELAPIAKVEADCAAQQHRLHRQDNLQPLHNLHPVLAKERTSVGQHNCQGK